MTVHRALTVTVWPPVAVKVSVAPPELSNVVSCTETVTDPFAASDPPLGETVTWALELLTLQLSGPPFEVIVTAALSWSRLISRGVTLSAPRGTLLDDGGVVVVVVVLVVVVVVLVVVVVVTPPVVRGGTTAFDVVVEVVVVGPSVVVTVVVVSPVVVKGGGSVGAGVYSDGGRASRWSAWTGARKVYAPSTTMTALTAAIVTHGGRRHSSLPFGNPLRRNRPARSARSRR